MSVGEPMVITPKDDHLRCHDHCPGACRCCLGSDIKHQLHICEAPHCYCHSPQRYGRRSWAEAEDAYRQEAP